MLSSIFGGGSLASIRMGEVFYQGRADCSVWLGHLQAFPPVPSTKISFIKANGNLVTSNRLGMIHTGKLWGRMVQRQGEVCRPQHGLQATSRNFSEQAMACDFSSLTLWLASPKDDHPESGGASLCQKGSNFSIKCIWFKWPSLPISGWKTGQDGEPLWPHPFFEMGLSVLTAQSSEESKQLLT